MLLVEIATIIGYYRAHTVGAILVMASCCRIAVCQHLSVLALEVAIAILIANRVPIARTPVVVSNLGLMVLEQLLVEGGCAAGLSRARPTGHVLVHSEHGVLGVHFALVQQGHLLCALVEGGLGTAHGGSTALVVVVLEALHLVPQLLLPAHCGLVLPRCVGRSPLRLLRTGVCIVPLLMATKADDTLVGQVVLRVLSLNLFKLRLGDGVLLAIGTLVSVFAATITYELLVNMLTNVAIVVRTSYNLVKLSVHPVFFHRKVG